MFISLSKSRSQGHDSCHIANISVYYCLAKLTLVYACCGDTSLGSWFNGTVLFDKPDLSLTARPRLHYAISVQEWHAVDFRLFRVQEKLPDCLDHGTLLLITGLIGKRGADDNIRVSFWAEVNTASWQASTHILSDDRP
jgi:hypothetical protein